MSRLPAAERREQLLDVAREVFARHGFHETSMNDVAEAAGVTKPVLYQHFGSKRDLYLELLTDVGGQLLEAIGAATGGAAGPRQQVESGFAAYFRFVSEHPNAFRVLFGSGSRRDRQFAETVRQVETSIADGRTASSARTTGTPESAVGVGQPDARGDQRRGRAVVAGERRRRERAVDQQRQAVGQLPSPPARALAQDPLGAGVEPAP